MLYKSKAYIGLKLFFMQNVHCLSTDAQNNAFITKTCKTIAYQGI